MADNTPAAVALALLMLAFLRWRLRPVDFRSLSWWSFAGSSAIFWAFLAAVLYLAFWQTYYSYFAPPANRILAPFAAAVIYSLVAVLLRWLALRLPGNPAITFALLGGLESIPEHAVGIYNLGILRIPLLQGATPASIFIFAFFEYVIYWGLVLLLAKMIYRIRKHRPVPTTEPEPQQPLPPNNSMEPTRPATANRV